MLNIGGELSFILKDIDYSSKNELLEKLNEMKNSLYKRPIEDRLKLRQILKVSIQQAFCTSEWELLDYKKYCKYRSEYGRSENNKSVD